MVLEMRSRKVAFEQEVPVRVSYRGEEIPRQRIDLVVGGLVVELKSVAHLDRIHIAQVISYLKTTNLRAGLLLNFRVPVMRQGIRRVVL